jgi:hypothetical protein
LIPIPVIGSVHAEVEVETGGLISLTVEHGKPTMRIPDLYLSISFPKQLQLTGFGSVGNKILETLVDAFRTPILNAVRNELTKLIRSTVEESLIGLSYAIPLAINSTDVHMPLSTLEFQPVTVGYAEDYLVVDLNIKRNDVNSDAIGIQQAVVTDIELQPFPDKMVTAAVAPEVGEDFITWYARDQMKKDYGLYTLYPQIIDRHAAAGFTLRTDTYLSVVTFPHLDTLFGYGEDLQLDIQLASDPEISFSGDDVHVWVIGNYNMKLNKTGELLFRLTSPVEIRFKTWVQQHPQTINISIDFLDIKQMRVTQQHPKIHAVHTSYMNLLFKFLADTVIREELAIALNAEDTNIENLAPEFDLVNMTIDAMEKLAVVSSDVHLNMSAILSSIDAFKLDPNAPDVEPTCAVFACPSGYKPKEGTADLLQPEASKCCREASACEACLDRDRVYCWVGAIPVFRPTGKWSCEPWGASMCTGNHRCKPSAKDVFGVCNPKCP